MGVNSMDLLQEVLAKIEDGTVQKEDFNRLILARRPVLESTPEAIRDRVRRRTSENPTDSHLSHDGHQPLSGPQFVDRVAPKRKPVGQQGHGISKLAHRQSTRTQRRRAMEAVEFIVKSHNKPISESELSQYDTHILSAVISKLMADPRLNRDWLYSLSKLIECQTQKT